MRIEAPELEKVKRENIETDSTKEVAEEMTPDTLSGATGGSRVETQEVREAKIAESREEVMKAVDTAQIANDAPAEFAPVQNSELPPGTPAVFQKLLEISAQVTELLNSINGDVKGIKKLTSFFTKGYNKDVLELAEKGARKVLSNPTKMEIYRKSLEQGGSKLAWEYVQESASNDYLDVVDGKIVEKSVTKSTDFRGSSSE